MENSKTGSNDAKATTNDENPGNINSSEVNENENCSINQSRQRRTPFTNLSQIDADLALARTLQEQERAYMMIRNGSDYGSWGIGTFGSYEHEDDDFDDLSEDDYAGSDAGNDDDHELDFNYIDDEEEEEEVEEDAFDVHAHAENREMATGLLSQAGISENEAEDAEDRAGNSQHAWDEVDPDELSYEELIALGEVVGNESRGLSADKISSLPSINYKMQSTQDGCTESCVICWLDYEDGDTLTVLSCKHSYHSECINNWLQINKVCPVCNAEVFTS